MVVNPLANVASALDGFPMIEKYCWLDSNVDLHWIRSPGTYQQFVSNRVGKIQAHSEVTWRHVGTLENPADLGSHGGEVLNHTSLCNRPKWLKNKACWPPNIVTKASEESMAEVKAMREVFAVALVTTDELDTLLEKSNYWKTMTICAWIMQFVHNVRSKKIGRLKGPQLDLQPNQDGVLECRGRIQGHFTVYLPDSQRFTEKLATQVHLKTLHGGVVSTMAKVRELYWVLRLRRLTKRRVKSCHGCRRFQAQAFVGVDYTELLKYCNNGKTEGKAHVLLYACSLTCALFLDLLPNLETKEFLASFKHFTARR